jgi:hypothetical protein
MKFAEATNLHRKSGVAEWRDLPFPSMRKPRNYSSYEFYWGELLFVGELGLGPVGELPNVDPLLEPKPGPLLDPKPGPLLEPDPGPLLGPKLEPLFDPNPLPEPEPKLEAEPPLRPVPLVPPPTPPAAATTFWLGSYINSHWL